MEYKSLEELTDLLPHEIVEEFEKALIDLSSIDNFKASSTGELNRILQKHFDYTNIVKGEIIGRLLENASFEIRDREN